MRGLVQHEPPIAVSDDDPDAGADTNLGEGHRESPGGDVVNNREVTSQSGGMSGHEKGRGQIGCSRSASQVIEHHGGIGGSGEVVSPFRPHHPDLRPRFGPVEPRRRSRDGIAEAEHAHDGGGVDVNTVGLVVEGNVAADDGHLECFAGCRHPFDRLDELPHHARLLRVPEVQVVDDGVRHAPRDGDVQRRFADESLGAAARIQIAPQGVAIGRDGQALVRSLDAHQRSVVARLDDRIDEEHVVVLLIDPGAIAQRRIVEEAEKGFAEVDAGGVDRRIRPAAFEGFGLFDRPSIQRGVFGERSRWNCGDGGAVLEHSQHIAVGDGADRGGLDLPRVGQAEDLFDVVGPDHGQHALLGLRHEDLAGVHPGFPQVDGVEIDVHAHPTSGGALGGGAGDAGGTEILDGDDQPALVQLEAGLDELLLLERVTDLDRGSLGPGFLVEGGRGQDGGTADPVTPGRGSQENRPVAHPRRRPSHELFPPHEAERHDVDQRVLGEPIGELDLASEGRHADRVAVAGDAGDNTGEQIPVVGFGERPETERVPDAHRAGPHGEDVAEDSPDAGRRSLVGLDEGRMVVALDPQRRQPTVAEIHHPRVFPRAQYDPGVV